MSKLTIIAALLSVSAALAPGTALACAPAPSCWIDEGPEYLRSVCQGYADDHLTLSQIATYLDEPEKIEDFGLACAKVGVKLVPGGYPRHQDCGPGDEGDPRCPPR